MLAAAVIGQKNSARFAATIYKIGINRCVSVPQEISSRFGKSRYIPVVATVRGVRLRTTIVPAGAGSSRLYLNSAMRKAACADAGDTIWIELRADRESREIAVPADISAALRLSRAARAAWNVTTTALRREFLRWVLAAKQPETRARRIRRGLQTLEARAEGKQKAPARGRG